MKRKIIIIVSIILVLIMVSLYYTYAIDVSMEETNGSDNLTYNFNLSNTNGRSITIKAGETKTFDIFVKNTNEVTVTYGLAYDQTNNKGVSISQLDNSINKTSGIIEKGVTNQISLIIINNSSSNATCNIIPVMGYEKGGDLIVPSGYTLINSVYQFPLDTSGAITQN